MRNEKLQREAFNAEDAEPKTFNAEGAEVAVAFIPEALPHCRLAL